VTSLVLMALGVVAVAVVVFAVSVFSVRRPRHGARHRL